MRVYKTQKAVENALKRKGWHLFPHRVDNHPGNRDYPAGGYIPVMICDTVEDLNFFRENDVRAEFRE